MAAQIKYPGRLIAATARAAGTADAADAIVDELARTVSKRDHRWDARPACLASRLGARNDRTSRCERWRWSYAARSRLPPGWEIRPGVEGRRVWSWRRRTSRQWWRSARHAGLRKTGPGSCCSFAPAADVRGRAEERKVDRRGIGARVALSRYGAVMLDASAPRKVAKRARHEMMAMLDQARGRKVVTLTGKGLETIAKRLLAAGRRAAPVASRPRIGHK